MPLPPKGDPQRPLHLAVRSTRVMGIIFLAMGMCTAVPFILRGGPIRGGGLPLGRVALVVAVMILVYFAPVCLYLICSVFIARRRTWAVITALVLAGIHVLFMVIQLVGLGIAMSSAPPGARMGYLLIPLGALVLITLALGQLMYHLSKCFEAIRLAPVEMQRGFEPLQSAQVLPLAQPGESGLP